MISAMDGRMDWKPGFGEEQRYGCSHNTIGAGKRGYDSDRVFGTAVHSSAVDGGRVKVGDVFFDSPTNFWLGGVGVRVSRQLTTRPRTALRERPSPGFRELR